VCSTASPQRQRRALALRGITEEMLVYEIP
jgi:hypothetical protein